MPHTGNYSAFAFPNSLRGVAIPSKGTPPATAARSGSVKTTGLTRAASVAAPQAAKGLAKAVSKAPLKKKTINGNTVHPTSKPRRGGSTSFKADLG